MEEAILELELLKLEKEKAENPTMNLSKRREPILKQFIAAIRKNDERDNLLLEEIVSLKAKNVELTGKSLSEALLFAEHVMYKNWFECQKQFLYTTCSPQV